MEWYYDILFCSVYFLVDFTIFFLFILECSNFSNSQFYLIKFYSDCFICICFIIFFFSIFLFVLNHKYFSFHVCNLFCFDECSGLFSRSMNWRMMEWQLIVTLCYFYLSDMLSTGTIDYHFAVLLCIKSSLHICTCAFICQLASVCSHVYIFLYV